jgi:hypothetical protein
MWIPTPVDAGEDHGVRLGQVPLLFLRSESDRLAPLHAGFLSTPRRAAASQPGAVFIPPDADNFRYEAKIGKNLAKFNRCVLKCHASRAKGKLPDDITEENCEGGCQTKYDLANSKLIAPPLAAACLNTVSLRNLWASQLDSFNTQIYCAGTTPFGGDDTGFIPPDSGTFKCESKVGSTSASCSPARRSATRSAARRTASRATTPPTRSSPPAPRAS